MTIKKPHSNFKQGDKDNSAHQVEEMIWQWLDLICTSKRVSILTDELSMECVENKSIMNAIT